MTIYSIKNLYLDRKIQVLHDYQYVEGHPAFVEPIKGPEPYTRIKAVRQRQHIGKEAFLTYSQALEAATKAISIEIVRLESHIEHCQAILFNISSNQ